MNALYVRDHGVGSDEKISPAPLGPPWQWVELVEWHLGKRKLRLSLEFWSPGPRHSLFELTEQRHLPSAALRNGTSRKLELALTQAPAEARVFGCHHRLPRAARPGHLFPAETRHHAKLADTVGRCSVLAPAVRPLNVHKSPAPAKHSSVLIFPTRQRNTTGFHTANTDQFSTAEYIHFPKSKNNYQVAEQ